MKKRDRLSEYCAGRNCTECVLDDVCRCGRGYSFTGTNSITNAEVIEAYDMVFGDYNEKDETVVIIKSSKNIDNITIYFKED